MWSEGELSFADDGTMVFTTSREDLAVAPGDPKDIYITTFNKEAGKWNKPRNLNDVFVTHKINGVWSTPEPNTDHRFRVAALDRQAECGVPTLAPPDLLNSNGSDRDRLEIPGNSRRLGRR